MTPKKGEVYWVKLDPTEGKEINKTRPCVIISSDSINQSEIIIVAPITSKVSRIFPRVEVKILLKGKTGKVLLRHLRSIDKTRRLGKKIDLLSPEEMNVIDNTLMNIFDFKYTNIKGINE